MKKLQLLSVALLSLFVLQASAQTEAPKGFGKGKVVLPGNVVVSGFIKDNIRKEAELIMMVDGKEKTYTGTDISSAEVNSINFICIKGDFFKVVSSGELSFLQKSSDASSKPSYNGNEVMFINGTEGNRGDYFIYNTAQELKLVSKKNLDALIAASFGNYAPAIEKAKAAQGDIALLKDAVDVYNSRGVK
jgi:hypothetical protein